jgi:hypothetical protein
LKSIGNSRADPLENPQEKEDTRQVEEKVHLIDRFNSISSNFDFLQSLTKSSQSPRKRGNQISSSSPVATMQGVDLLDSRKDNGIKSRQKQAGQKAVRVFISLGFNRFQLLV